MSKSSIVINFSAPFVVDDTLSFTYQISGGGLVMCSETWVNVRSAPGEVNTNPPQEATILGTMYDYVDAFNLDYNTSGLFTVTIDTFNDEVTILAKVDGVVFSAFGTTGSATAVIDNVAYVPPFNITSVSFSEAVTNDKCTHVKIDVVTSDITATVTSPVSLNPGASSFSFEHVRGISSTLTCSDGTTPASEVFTTPAVLGTPMVEVAGYPSGARVQINITSTLTLTYSLDGTTYVSGNTFTGIAEGAYTAYVKDQYGCVKTAAFTVDAYTPVVNFIDPAIYISKTNPIHFAKYVESKIYENIDNTNSCYEHKFKPDQPITLYIETSYTDLKAYVNLVGVYGLMLYDAVKMSSNLEVTDTRGCYIFDKGSGVTGIYFDELPEWATIGQSFYVDSLADYFLIDDVKYDSSKNAKVITFQSTFSGVETTDSVTAIYNRFPYEVYQININPYTFSGNRFKIYLEFTDAGFGEEVYVSNMISIEASLKGYDNIKYKNSENNDIIWNYMSWFEINLENDLYEYDPDSENDNNKTDIGITPISSNKYDKYKISYAGLTEEMAVKVYQVFGCDVIMINDETYVVESREKSSFAKASKLYSVSITAYKLTDTIGNAYVSETFFPRKYVISDILSYGAGILTDYEGNIIGV